jgi:2-amino-4-hydroxy-6-hydroxymethyldihydropteridine diphosphokinase
MNIALISAGSNLNPAQNIEKAKVYLARKFSHVAFSKNRTTKPVGFVDQPDFINAVFCITTNKGRSALKLLLHEIEDRLGRVRAANKYGPRTIDLDIVVWNGEIVDEDVYTRDFLGELVVEMMPEMKEKIKAMKR